MSERSRLRAWMDRSGGVFFFSSRRRHTRLQGDWSSDVCSSDLEFQTYKPTEYSTVLSAAMQAGKGPDIVHLRAYGALQPFARPEFLVPLEDKVPEIGRASCRGRVEISVGGGSLKKKKDI